MVVASHRLAPILSGSRPFFPYESPACRDLVGVTITSHVLLLSNLKFHFSTFLTVDRPSLLHFRTQSILSLLVEDSDANRCGKEVVHRWNYFHN